MPPGLRNSNEYTSRKIQRSEILHPCDLPPHLITAHLPTVFALSCQKGQRGQAPAARPAAPRGAEGVSGPERGAAPYGASAAPSSPASLPARPAPGSARRSRRQVIQNDAVRGQKEHREGAVPALGALTI